MNTPSSNTAEALLTPSALHNDAHFLRAVTAMADSHEVLSGNAIYSESGIKLIEQGVRIDSRLCERLIQHRLAVAVDDQLTTSNAVDIRALEAQVQVLMGSTVLGQQLAQFMGDKQHMLVQVLRRMHWPQRASFKLTVMRHQFPQLFEHSVLMMMAAVCLAMEEGLQQEDCAGIAAAALLHDVGMLYMPASWIDPSYKLNGDERKQLAAHSITAMLVVRSAQTYGSKVENAVLEHHERLDGSGYPRGTKGDEISHWGRILMLAEVVAAFFSKFSDIPAQRLSLMLRMNHNRFDPQLTQHVFRLLAQASAGQSSDSHSTAEVRQIIATLGAVFQYWGKCKRSFPEQWQTLPGGRAGLYVDARLQALEKSLAESGSHPRQQADWLAMFEEDPSSMSEVVLINKEALWQVESCVEACIRRWPQLLQPSTAYDEAMHDWLLSCRKVFGYSDDAAAAAQAASVEA